MEVSPLKILKTTPEFKDLLPNRKRRNALEAILAAYYTATKQDFRNLNDRPSLEHLVQTGFIHEEKHRPNIHLRFLIMTDTRKPVRVSPRTYKSFMQSLEKIRTKGIPGFETPLPYDSSRTSSSSSSSSSSVAPSSTTASRASSSSASSSSSVAPSSTTSSPEVKDPSLNERLRDQISAIPDSFFEAKTPPKTLNKATVPSAIDSPASAFDSPPSDATGLSTSSDSESPSPMPIRVHNPDNLRMITPDKRALRQRPQTPYLKGLFTPQQLKTPVKDMLRGSDEGDAMLDILRKADPNFVAVFDQWENKEMTLEEVLDRMNTMLPLQGALPSRGVPRPKTISRTPAQGAQAMQNSPLSRPPQALSFTPPDTPILSAATPPASTPQQRVTPVLGIQQLRAVQNFGINQRPQAILTPNNMGAQPLNQPNFNIGQGQPLPQPQQQQQQQPAQSGLNAAGAQAQFDQDEIEAGLVARGTALNAAQREGIANSQMLKAGNVSGDSFQFRPHYANAYKQAQNLYYFRTPEYKEIENRQWADFTYVPEGSGEQTYENARGANPLHNYNKLEHALRFQQPLYSVHNDYEPPGQNFTWSQRYEGLHTPKAKRPRFNDTSSVHFMSQIPGETNLRISDAPNPVLSRASFQRPIKSMYNDYPLIINEHQEGKGLKSGISRQKRTIASATNLIYRTYKQ